MPRSATVAPSARAPRAEPIARGGADVPSLLAASYAGAVVALLAGPVLSARAVAAHLGTPLRDGAHGALGLMLAQLALGLAATALAPALAAREGAVRVVLLAGTSALVEEGMRLWLFRRFLARAQAEGSGGPGLGARALLFGMGWAGCEAILAGGFVLASLAQLLHGDPERALAELLTGADLEAARRALAARRQELLGAPAWGPLSLVAERAGVAGVQLLLAGLVFRAVRLARLRPFLVALGLDFVLGAMLLTLGRGAALGTWASAGAAVLFGLVALPLGLALLRRAPDATAGS